MGIFHKQAGGGFAVVDVETTGIYPSRDRVIEVAIVHLDPMGEPQDEFCTLIDPGRDVGPTSIHGITAADVLGAPSFAAAARTVWDRLVGMVLVAHNASFDRRFLEAELGRCGTRLPPPPVMCTMQLASHYLERLPARRLDTCCEAAGIELSHHHSALEDARAAAKLLACFLKAHGKLPSSWRGALEAGRRAVWSPMPAGEEVAAVTRSQQFLRRQHAGWPLAGLIRNLPRGRHGHVDAYLGVLDRVLEDRVVTEHELDELSLLALEIGLARESAEDAHRAYLRHLCAAAWLDGTVTESERDDLLDVARLLGIPTSEAEQTLQRARDAAGVADEDAAFDVMPRALQVGDRVAITGETKTSRSKLEAMAADAGLRVTGAVSGKTAVLLAADPCSQSGKAKTARERGVRIVTEQVFLYLLEDVRASCAE